MIVRLKYSEIKNVELNCTVLRACDEIPLSVAFLLNEVVRKLATPITQYDQMIDTINERGLEGEFFDEAVKQCGLIQFDCEFDCLPYSLFDGVNISGVKKIIQRIGDQAIEISFPYRDAFFELLNVGVIK